MLQVMFGHYLGDFLCQSRWMANNKSKSILALTTHVAVYTVVLMSYIFIMFLAKIGLEDIRGNMLWPMPTLTDFGLFAATNALLHWLTDFTTSRINSYYFDQQNYYMFFNTVGFDQFIHFGCLFITYHIWLK